MVEPTQIRIQTPKTFCLNAAQLKLENLLNWAKVEGARFKNIRFELSECNGNVSRKGFLINGIKAGSELLSCPIHLRISETLARKSEVGLALDKLLLSNPGWARSGSDPLSEGTLYMIAYLLQELKLSSDSCWHAYLDSLPTDMSHLPVSWSEADLDLLKSTQLYDITQHKLGLLRDGCNLLKADWNTFLWCYSVFLLLLQFIR